MTKRYRNIFIAGIKDKRFDLTVENGRFSSVTESFQPPAAGPETDQWIAPGLIDLHVHLAWTDFDFADQQKRTEDEIERLQAQALEATLQAGVTTVRDAGGLLPDDAARLCGKYRLPLQVVPCGAMLGGEDAKGCRYLEKRVEQISRNGAEWIKLFATGGLGSPTEKVLDPIFSKKEFFTIVRCAHALHRKVMVHTWGGPTLDWTVEAGADTAEHGVFMTADQAVQMAQHKIPLIPTTAIYRIAADPSGALALPRELCERAARAAQAQMKSVRYAKQAGVRIGFGTDFATPALHGRNPEELDTLMDCGLTRREAWQAATTTASEILGFGETLGSIQNGSTADAVIYSRDPYEVPDAKELRKSIVSVIKGTAETD